MIIWLCSGSVCSGGLIGVSGRLMLNRLFRLIVDFIVSLFCMVLYSLCVRVRLRFVLLYWWVIFVLVWVNGWKM